MHSHDPPAPIGTVNTDAPTRGRNSRTSILRMARPAAPRNTLSRRTSPNT
jgi:hypothetical protein